MFFQALLSFSLTELVIESSTVSFKCSLDSRIPVEFLKYIKLKFFLQTEKFCLAETGFSYMFLSPVF